LKDTSADRPFLTINANGMLELGLHSPHASPKSVVDEVKAAGPSSVAAGAALLLAGNGLRPSFSSHQLDAQPRTVSAGHVRYSCITDHSHVAKLTLIHDDGYIEWMKNLHHSRLINSVDRHSEYWLTLNYIAPFLLMV
jgi:hypothetical protein